MCLISVNFAQDYKEGNQGFLSGWTCARNGRTRGGEKEIVGLTQRAVSYRWPANLIFSRHIEVHSLPADSDHYSLSVTTRHDTRIAWQNRLLLIRLAFLFLPAERSKKESTARREEGGSGVLRKRLKTSSSLECR